MRGPLLVVGIVIALVWLLPSLLPDDSGWRLGLPFRVFYTAIALLGLLFYFLLEAPAPRQPSSGLGAFAWTGAVYLLTVGFLVALGIAFPNFDLPTEVVAVSQTSAERGEALFFDTANTCLLCHAVDGQGGTRGPDLSGLASHAGDRVEGLGAEEYIRQSILESTAFVVEGFDPIMPPGLINVIGEDNLDDLIAFLMTLE
ncbi:MAG: c-type cytochrome [Anaerolineales bacterium]